jgi:DNA helicase-2/ATP-dependent DNA helicase PcrA
MPIKFSSEYSKLNGNQKEAVDYIEGPLLVIAGPGTGKTQLLSLRAANILNKTDVLPENILCLTYTESGAQEMRARLIKMIGEDAYRISINTYHSFGSDIIRKYPSYFLGSFNLRPINDLKADTIIRDIQKGLSYTNDLKNPQSVSSIKSLISDAKKALLSPKDIADIAHSNLDFITRASNITKALSEDLKRASMKSIEVFKKIVTPDRPTKLPGNVESLNTLWNIDLKEAIDLAYELNKATSLSRWKAKYLAKDEKDFQIAKGREQNLKLIEFSKIYAEYIERLGNANLYDYDDMILFSIEAIKKQPELRFNLQEQYLYIMLDEYQDTNRAQAELVSQLTNNPVSAGQPNVMAVGDDDQAIYAFQGAKHSNMLDFVNQYKEVKTITLKTNYRSSQQIIDLSSKVGDQIKARLTDLLEIDNKDFKAGSNSPSKITNLNFESEIDQYLWLAKQLKGNSDKTVAIISPEHKYLERASAYLLEEGLAISYDRQENVLDDPLIAQIINILRLLKAINDQNHRLIDSMAAIVLNYDFWRLPTADIWKLSWEASDTRKSWIDIMLGNPGIKEIAEMLIKMAANSLSYRYDFIIDQVIGLSDIVTNETKTKSSRSPFLEYYSKGSDDLVASQLYQNLMVLRQQFKDFNADNNKPLMIADLLSFIDELQASGIKLSSNIHYGQTDSKIKLVTAHGSKGQEFDSVYILSLTNEVWGPKSRNFNQISLPANLTFIKQSAEDSEDEKLRLLYVALTRAKSQIVTLGYNQDIAGRLTTPLKYLNEPTTTEKTKAKIDLAPLWQKDDKTPEIKTDLKELLKKRLENYSLSPTELNTFLDIRNAGPESFYKNVLLKYKTPVSPRVDYGSAVHESLDWLQQSFKASGKLPTITMLTNEFEKELLKRRLLPHDFERLKEQGTKSLTVYYKNNKLKFSRDDLSEYNFRSEGITSSGVRLSGKIDKLLIDNKSKTIKIIDYKTGRGYSRWQNEPKLHLYKYQLYFYKLLVDKSLALAQYRLSGASLEFIEPDRSTDELHSLNLTYDSAELKHFMSLIEAVWKHINDLNFPDISGYRPYYSDMIKFEDDLIAGRI